MEQIFWYIFIVTTIVMVCYAAYLFKRKRDNFYDFVGNLVIAIAGFALAGALLWREFSKAEIEERYHECNILLVMQKEIQRKIANFDQLALLFTFIDSSLTEKKLVGLNRDEAMIFHLSNELSLFSNDFRYELFYDPGVAHLFKPGFFYIIDSLVYQIQYVEDLIIKNREYAEQYRITASDANKYNPEQMEIRSYYDPRVYQTILRTQLRTFHEVFNQKHKQIKTYYQELHQEIDKRYTEIYKKHPEILEQITDE